MYRATPTLTKEKANAERGWVLVDAKDQTLGRLSTRVATLLRGKHKPEWAPHVDNGEYVVVVNAERVVLTGRKLAAKKYYRHSGYPGHLKQVSAARMLETHPDRVIQHAVRGMLPKNKLGRALLRKLKVYAGEKHPHEAQCPEAIRFD